MRHAFCVSFVSFPSQIAKGETRPQNVLFVFFDPDRDTSNGSLEK